MSYEFDFDEDGAVNLRVPEEMLQDTKKAVKKPGVRVSPSTRDCSTESVLETIDMLDRGTRQKFLNGELEPDVTKHLLGVYQTAKEACEAGDNDACAVWDELSRNLSRKQ
jgi:hypothetical protein